MVLIDLAWIESCAEFAAVGSGGSTSLFEESPDEAGRRNISVAQIKVTLIAGGPKNKRNRFWDMSVGYSLAAR
jgi:hypothetical protein